MNRKIEAIGSCHEQQTLSSDASCLSDCPRYILPRDSEVGLQNVIFLNLCSVRPKATGTGPVALQGALLLRRLYP